MIMGKTLCSQQAWLHAEGNAGPQLRSIKSLPRRSLTAWGCAVPMPANTYDGHALYQASSPLVRALPDYARQFQQHLARGEALLLLTQVHSHSQSLIAPMRKPDAE